MARRYFSNPYEDYKGGEVQVNQAKMLELITKYVDSILRNKQFEADQRPDLYVGDAGNSRHKKSFKIGV